MTKKWLTVFPLPGIALDHLISRLEAGVGDLRDRQLLMIRLRRGDDGGVGGEGEVDPGVWDQVGLELGDVDVAELEFGVADVGDVLQRAGLEVVEADHPVPLAEQVLAEMGTEEAGAAGHYAGRHRDDAIGVPRGWDSGGIPAISDTAHRKSVQSGGERAHRRPSH